MFPLFLIFYKWVLYVTNAVKTPKVGYSILLIEKSKVTMIIEDIAAMLKIIDNI